MSGTSKYLRLMRCSHSLPDRIGIVSAKRTLECVPDLRERGRRSAGLTTNEGIMFLEGQQRAIQLEAVCDSCADLVLGSFIDPAKANLVTKTNSSGLGIRFNGDQCLSCHNQPALGGSGGFMVPNPQDPPRSSAGRKTRSSI